MSSVILPGAVLAEGMDLAAGSVAIRKTQYDKHGVYSGVPAIKICNRTFDLIYKQGGWKPWFR